MDKNGNPRTRKDYIGAFGVRPSAKQVEKQQERTQKLEQAVEKNTGKQAAPKAPQKQSPAPGGMKR